MIAPLEQAAGAPAQSASASGLPVKGYARVWVDHPGDYHSRTTLRGWLAEGPFALAMSSGFFSFYAHCGMLVALEEADLLPVRLSGSGAGGLVAGLWAGGLDAQGLAVELLRVRRQDFWDPGPGLGLLRGRLFRDHLEAVLPVSRFEQCRVPLAISVFDVPARRTRVISEGPLAVALHATCAVPFLFHPVRDGGVLLADGGIADRPGLAGIPEGTRLLFHHISAGSPWHRKDPNALAVPRRAGMVVLTLAGLPRVHPFAMHRGAEALNPENWHYSGNIEGKMPFRHALRSGRRRRVRVEGRSAQAPSLQEDVQHVVRRLLFIVQRTKGRQTRQLLKHRQES